jgi:YebC/PmpR family DNA-binding regulatory protein
VLYEGYGPGGAAIIVEAMTDNKNRTTPEIRSSFTKFGTELGASNSVAYMFVKQGQIVVDPEVPEDKVMEVALEAGADDVKDEDGAWVITMDPNHYQVVKDAVDAAKLPVIEAGIVRTSAVRVAMAGDKLKSFLKFIDLLEDNDDVQNVWTNADYDEPDE